MPFLNFGGNKNKQRCGSRFIILERWIRGFGSESTIPKCGSGKDGYFKSRHGYSRERLFQIKERLFQIKEQLFQSRNGYCTSRNCYSISRKVYSKMKRYLKMRNHFFLTDPQFQITSNFSNFVQEKGEP